MSTYIGGHNREWASTKGAGRLKIAIGPIDLGRCCPAIFEFSGTLLALRPIVVPLMVVVDQVGQSTQESYNGPSNPKAG